MIGIYDAANVGNRNQVGVDVDSALRAGSPDPGFDRHGNAADQRVPRNHGGEDVNEDQDPRVDALEHVLAPVRPEFTQLVLRRR